VKTKEGPKEPRRPKFTFRLWDTSRIRRFPIVHEGDEVECYECGRTHILKSAVALKSKKRSTLFLIYKCRKSWSIGALNGRLVAGRRPDMQVP
jgi:hypothetical protein